MSRHFCTYLDMFRRVLAKNFLSQFLYLDILSHVFDRTKYTLHSTKYALQRTHYTSYNSGMGCSRDGISGDGEFTKRKIDEIGFSGDEISGDWCSGDFREFRRWGYHDMRCSRDGEFTRWGIHVIGCSGYVEFTRRGVHEIGSSGDGDFTRLSLHDMGL